MEYLWVIFASLMFVVMGFIGGLYMQSVYAQSVLTAPVGYESYVKFDGDVRGKTDTGYFGWLCEIRKRFGTYKDIEEYKACMLLQLSKDAYYTKN